MQLIFKMTFRASLRRERHRRLGIPADAVFRAAQALGRRWSVPIHDRLDGPDAIQLSSRLRGGRIMTKEAELVWEDHKRRYTDPHRGRLSALERCTTRHRALPMILIIHHAEELKRAVVEAVEAQGRWKKALSDDDHANRQAQQHRPSSRPSDGSPVSG